MSAKMKRRRRHDRRKRIMTYRLENALFWARGTIPASAVAFASCSCGGSSFSRVVDPEFHADFEARHGYCDEVSA